MIQSVVHKGLRLLYEKGKSAKLPAEYVPKIALVLDALDAVTTDADIMALGMGVHQLSGNYAGFWAVKISPNYRIVFRLYQGDIYDVDYLDYHYKSTNYVETRTTTITSRSHPARTFYERT